MYVRTEIKYKVDFTIMCSLVVQQLALYNITLENLHGFHCIVKVYKYVLSNDNWYSSLNLFKLDNPVISSLNLCQVLQW